MISRKDIRETLKKGVYSKEVGQVKITLQKQGSAYRIVLSENGKKPKVWFYRDMGDAIDRYCEQLEQLMEDR